MRGTAFLLAATLGMAGSAFLYAPPAYTADTQDDLARGRALFQHGLELERKSDFPGALAAFERVREIRDTAQVRYRIGVCLAAVGRLQEASAAFGRAAAMAENVDPTLQRAAQDRATETAALIPELTVRLADAEGMEVRLDGAPVPSAKAAQPMPVDPGKHRVVVSGPNRKDESFDVTLKERERLVLAVHPGELSSAPGASSPARDAPTNPSAPTSPTTEPRPMWPAWVALGGGALLLVGGFTMLAIRAGDISTLEGACPAGVCPSSRRDELTSTRDRALLLGPLSAVFLSAGAVSAGAGVVLWVMRKDSAARASNAAVRARGSFLSVEGSF